MTVNSINLFLGGMVSFSAGPDEEHKKIMRRLKAYGITPTGNKTSDREKLYQIEIKLAKQENCVSNKFLTVSISEQEKIQEKKKKKRLELNPEPCPDTSKAEIILGEQKYLAIQMKKR